MNLQRKQERIYINKEFNREVYLLDQERFGWKLEYQPVEEIKEGNQVTFSLVRDKDLKYYKRLVDLEVKTKKLKDHKKRITTQVQSEVNKRYIGLDVQRSLAIFLAIGLVFVDLMMILSAKNFFTPFTFNKLIRAFVAVLVMGVLHFLNYLWFRYIKGYGRGKGLNEHLLKIDVLIELLNNKADNIKKI